MVHQLIQIWQPFKMETNFSCLDRTNIFTINAFVTNRLQEMDTHLLDIQMHFTERSRSFAAQTFKFTILKEGLPVTLKHKEEFSFLILAESISNPKLEQEMKSIHMDAVEADLMIIWKTQGVRGKISSLHSFRLPIQNTPDLIVTMKNDASFPPNIPFSIPVSFINVSEQTKDLALKMEKLDQRSTFSVEK
jgi:hypothetical protein